MAEVIGTLGAFGILIYIFLIIAILVGFFMIVSRLGKTVGLLKSINGLQNIIILKQSKDEDIGSCPHCKGRIAKYIRFCPHCDNVLVWKK